MSARFTRDETQKAWVEKRIKHCLHGKKACPWCRILYNGPCDDRMFRVYKYGRLYFSGWRDAAADEKGESVMEMEVSFPGGKKVNSTYKGFTVKTDQAKNEGGDGTAPEPYDLFLASIGTCAGVYVVIFCQERGIDTSQIKMTLKFNRNETKHLVETIRIHIDLPPGFPEKYKKAVIKTAELCTVKRNIVDPPRFSVSADIRN